jgi:VWFA-related protein
MNRYLRFFLTFACVIVFGVTAFGQDEEDVVKITSRLVQVDAVVTDKQGKQVTDLTAADFQILQDGKEQRITAFSYVPVGSPSLPSPDGTSVSITSTGARKKIGRVITFVVDDGNCRASSSGIRATREALDKFLAEQMLPEDQVAIYQTRAGSSISQLYTSDKALLQRTVSKIRWYPNAMGCPSNDGSYFEAGRVNTSVIQGATGMKAINEENAAERQRRELTEDRGRDQQVQGTIGVLRFALRGLERLPGRKVMFLMSDGMPYRARNSEMLDSIFFMRDLTEMANRAGVVVNTVDVRGDISTIGIEARDDVSTLSDAAATDQLVSDRRREEVNTRDGMQFLAYETGGQFFKNQTYLDKPISRALLIEKGYYLVAYEPDGETFKGKKFNKIEIKVSRSGTKVYSRTGFMGVTDQATSTKTATTGTGKSGDRELYDALTVPIATGGMSLGLTAYFGNSPAEGSIVRSLVHIPGSEVTFTDEPGGLKKATVDVVAVTMDEKSQVVDEFTRLHTFKVPAAAVPVIEKRGVIYSADVKVAKPGFYTYRIALRDVNSKRIGSASQVVEVPDLAKSKLFLSGLVATEADAKGQFETPKPADVNAAFGIPNGGGAPAIRSFKRNSVIAYFYDVYNAKPTASGVPNLTVEVNLFRDGKILIDGLQQPADLQPQSDWTRIRDFGYMKLNPDISPGDYVLQLVIRDLSGKEIVATQTTDFTVVD